MPTLKQNLNVLKNGIQKRGTREKPGDFDLEQTPPTRDHYERWAHYYKRQYPKRKQTPWVDVRVLERAVTAARDTPMGIIDTVTREYITCWMPDIMLFILTIDDDESGDDDVCVSIYKSLVDRVRLNVLDVLGRIDCGDDEAAKTLAMTLKEKAEDRLSKLFVVFEDQLTEGEKREYNPQHFETLSSKDRDISLIPTKIAQDPITEARILDSSLAWGLSDIRVQPKIPSPRKRRYSQVRSSPGPDPADNGQIWDSPKLDFKRQKFEFTFTTAVKYPGTNGYAIPSHYRTRNGTHPKHDTVDLTEDGDDTDDGPDQNRLHARDGVFDARESPGSQQKDGQCLLM